MATNISHFAGFSSVETYLESFMAKTDEEMKKHVCEHTTQHRSKNTLLQELDKKTLHDCITTVLRENLILEE